MFYNMPMGIIAKLTGDADEGEALTGYLVGPVGDACLAGG